jgi:hypothetical protein
MLVHIFKCSVTKNLYGFTQSKDASNLPPKSDIPGEWQPFKSIEITENTTSLIGAGPKEILNGIRKDGYYFSETPITFIES